ncbi:MAG: pyruvate dehydrogenase (acetyl-transferring) E1 component subunit alpha [Rhodothermia bacterium]|nr:MAG: pyruvate dehydrogenase (acetyl-transferring) E1 component subunit alpha [Rhodothermia bacterium]
MAKEKQRSKTMADRSSQKSEGRATRKRTTKSPKPTSAITDFPSEINISLTFEAYPAGKYTHGDLDLGDDQVLSMFQNMLLQRRFEERAAQMYGKQKIGGFLHLYIGQEAISTGSAAAINVGSDSVITAYRDHGLGLALGMSANECMAELFGKITGCSRGKGGSMHFFSKECRLFGGHGIVGAHVPVGVGVAFAHKYKEDGGICLTYFGDGAVGQGAVHEASNLASLYELPAILIIENNEYAMGTAIHRAFAETRFTHHAVSYHMPAAVVDGMDVFSVCKAIQVHADLARQGKPSILEIRTYRYRGHSMSDPMNYRTKEELDSKKNEDPILRLKAYIIENKLAPIKTLDQIDEEVKEVVLQAVEYAEESPAPELEAIYENIYEESDYPYLA